MEEKRVKYIFHVCYNDFVIHEGFETYTFCNQFLVSVFVQISVQYSGIIYSRSGIGYVKDLIVLKTFLQCQN